MPSVRVGLWLTGARGSVATTAVCGLLALRAGLVRPVGCVTETPEFPTAPVPDWGEIELGGHDVVDVPLAKRAARLADEGVLPPHVLTAVEPGLRAVEAEIRPGYSAVRDDRTQAAAIERLATDVRDFQLRNGLSHVVVINVASTEKPVPLLPEHEDLDALRAALHQPGREVLPPSSVNAAAALTAGAAYADFTPSPGIQLPALAQWAEHSAVPYAGADGKTGQTLLRTALAPVFTSRALEVRSWAGTNLLGGGDGANLGDPERAAGKLDSKQRGLAELLGDAVSSPLHIDNVPELGERKVAWDHVLFRGFLGAEMTLQLTWHGYDSSLAAPLVLDLARLLAAAQAAGRTGPQAELAFFFKNPIGCAEHRLAEQARMLVDWAAELGGRR